MQIYLQQFLSQAGLASRRLAIELIKQGQVKVNGKLGSPGQKIDPTQDTVKLNNQLIKLEKKVYYLVNKPFGYTSTVKDKFAGKIVTALVPPTPKVWPVGRLDKDSHGLILLTNDGQLTNQLTHPSFRHEKEYIIELDRDIQSGLLNKLIAGVTLEEGIAKADKVKQLNPTKLSITIHQGWKRQLRRMLHQCGYRIVELQRIRIGKYRLGKLKTGAYKRFMIPNFQS